MKIKIEGWEELNKDCKGDFSMDFEKLLKDYGLFGVFIE